MKTWILTLMLASTLTSWADRDLLLVRGAPGNDEFQKKFDAQAEHWRTAANHPDLTISEVHKGDEVQTFFKQTKNEGSLWIVFIGHGTYDGKVAKFNLEGPDLSDADWAELLKPVEREILLINTSAGSAPFLKTLAGENRIILTATRSGFESSYAYLGEFLASAFNQLDADFDKDGRISLLEAFIQASRRVADFYEKEERIQTEHALLDDNGDGKGTQGDWFVGVRPDRSKLKQTPPDGYRALQVYLAPEKDNGLDDAQRNQRDALERKLFSLRDQKADMDEAAFYEQLEALLSELNAFYPAKPD